MTLQEQIADALANAFKARVADKSGMTFEETGVSLPPRDIWLYYADATIDAIREPTDAMIETVYANCHAVKMAHEDSNVDFLAAAWRAMIDAARPTSARARRP